MKQERFATLYLGRHSFDVAEVTVEGQTRYLAEAEARTYYDDLSRARHTMRTFGFEAWWEKHLTKCRFWKAELVMAHGVEPIEIGENVDYRWGFPTAVAMQLLERLADDGWGLVSVSEDRGLYQGTDASKEAYVTRARYLLAR